MRANPSPAKDIKVSSTVPELSTLRRWCGKFSDGRWVYEALGVQPDNQPRGFEEIVAQVDKRTLDELIEQARNAIAQLQCRAYCGDSGAIAKLAFVTRGLVTFLETLAGNCPEKVQAIARTFATWPVNLSFNPQDITRAEELLTRLAVGTNSPTPTRPGQRVDPRNFWTQLAKQAFDACDKNRLIVPWLEGIGRGAHKKRITNRFWRKSIITTFYTLANGEMVVITDWQKRCVKLSIPITTDNFFAWWDVVKVCVLQHWKITSGHAYEKALAKISDKTAPKEFQKRNLALAQVREAFRSLVGLRQ